ncbi:hypothetical protein JSY14_08025 [Brachybacterium sp. EF45031]|uniref:hypothetical protein n=1 Tax=Brachybacterium sillae TaxID=2810536 RepID=UPI00217DEE6D|nr:hypothetical protein [Brachybacterium sillae]MCS6711967.1 hypothetical protein [Brachybacterium sillae]
MTYTGDEDTVQRWALASFPVGIQQPAASDDLPGVVELIGAGVQKRGDLVATGERGPVRYAVAIRPGPTRTVQVGIAAG